MEQKQKTKPARQQKRDRSHLVFMMIAAVIAEYNPFHNGHAYHDLFDDLLDGQPAANQCDSTRIYFSLSL